VYTITFKENRKYELVVNNQTVAIFYGRETKEVSSSVVESKDFESDRNYFIVSEEYKVSEDLKTPPTREIKKDKEKI
jgi:hypothetical protein